MVSINQHTLHLRFEDAEREFLQEITNEAQSSMQMDTFNS